MAIARIDRATRRNSAFARLSVGNTQPGVRAEIMAAGQNGRAGAAAREGCAIEIEQRRTKKPADRLQWLKDREHVSTVQQATGVLLIATFEKAKQEGYARRAMDGTPGGQSDPSVSRETAKRRLQSCWNAVGPKGEAVLTCIVIDGMSLKDTAAYLRDHTDDPMHPKAILPVLQIALDALGAHLKVEG